MGEFAKFVGIEPQEPESLPLEQKPRAELISLVIRLTEMTAQQSRKISELRSELDAK